MVIGCPGSGKSTFSRKLQGLTGLPLFHLDQMYWNADRTTVPKALFRERLAQVLRQSAWIIDGNYGATLEQRLLVCDTVFFLDYPLELCLEGVRQRRGKARPDLPWIEPVGEEDPEFLAFIRAYRQESRPKVLLLEQHPEKQIYIFTNRTEAEAYLRKLDSGGKDNEG
ncbi:MAG: adenylate kinase, partial [Oscillospiraceae bacterium]|nr:adenylate kinase [Oscillospiraceae bacterium]